MWSAGPATNHDSIDFCHLHIYAGPNGGGRDPWIETVRILGRDLTLQHYVLRIMQMSFRSFKFKLDGWASTKLEGSLYSTSDNPKTAQRSILNPVRSLLHSHLRDQWAQTKRF